ncbi:hypothetical protein BCEN4_1480010 [Burkholderia cenocepacia]|nr:hypothetical protein BCEN4_1480010 [Burkholderia cenocepacia]
MGNTPANRKKNGCLSTSTQSKERRILTSLMLVNETLAELVSSKEIEIPPQRRVEIIQITLKEKLLNPLPVKIRRLP